MSQKAENPVFSSEGQTTQKLTPIEPKRVEQSFEEKYKNVLGGSRTVRAEHENEIAITTYTAYEFNQSDNWLASFALDAAEAGYALWGVIPTEQIRTGQNLQKNLIILSQTVTEKI